jgi:hypothetical protein
MDAEVRGQIEKALDRTIASLDVREILKWLSDSDMIEMESKDVLALGYVLGYLSSSARGILSDQRFAKESQEEWEKISGKKLPEPRRKQRLIRISLKDTEEIRDMLKRRIENIREAVTQGLNA